MPDSGRRLWPAAAISRRVSPGCLQRTAFAALISRHPRQRPHPRYGRGRRHHRPRGRRPRVRAGAATTVSTSDPARIARSATAATTASTAAPARTGSGATAATDTLRGDVDDVGDLVSQDRLYGGRGDDKLFGGDGRDRLWGWLGNDALDGGRGNDRMLAGPGRRHGGRRRGQRLHVRRPRSRHAGRRVGDDVIFANQGRDHDRGRRRATTGCGRSRCKDVNGPADTRATPSAAAPATTGSRSATARSTS